MTVLPDTAIPSCVELEPKLPPVEVSPLPDVVHVRVIRELDDWEHLRPQWDELFEASPTASPPLRFDWLRTWWDIYGSTYGDGGRGVRIFTVWRGRTLIGACRCTKVVGTALSAACGTSDSSPAERRS